MSYPPQGSPVISVPSTLTGETIDAGSNTLKQVVQSSLISRYGLVSGGKGSNVILEGVFADHTVTGAASISLAWDAVEGWHVICTTTASANINAGLVSTTGGIGQAVTAWATRVRTRCKPIDVTSDSRFYFGFSSNSTLPKTDTPLATTEHGIIVGWRSIDSNFTIFHNDGSSVAEVVTAVAPAIPIDTSWHTFEINWVTGGFSANVIIDGTTTPITSRLPVITTGLYFHQVSQTTAAATAKTQKIHATFLESEK